MSVQTIRGAHDAEMPSPVHGAANSAQAGPSGTNSTCGPIARVLIDERNGPRRQYLDVPTTSTYRPRPSIDSTYSELSELSIYSDESQRRRPPVNNGTSRLQSPSATTPQHGWRGTLSALWIRNKGAVLVLLSQAFGSLMNVATRILETDGVHGKAMHPFQVWRPI
jgi:hypothetical protein